ncbi:MAG: arginine--tRNA ligase [Gammaproteobacteria bacterium]
MKDALSNLLNTATATLIENGDIPSDTTIRIQLDQAKGKADDRAHGDFASNLALTLAKAAKCKPRDLAEKIISALPASELLSKVEIAGPGFINFYLNKTAFLTVLPEIIKQGAKFGCSNIAAGKKVQVEFVSANPTGPLHVGHGRGAAFGAVVSNLLAAIGYQVHREYYVNDAGRQMDILAASVYLRYLDLCGETIVFPNNAYQGDYVWDIAATLHRENNDTYRHAIADVMKNVPDDLTDSNPDGDKEKHIDGIIANSKQLLGDNYQIVFDVALNHLLSDIKNDLESFGVFYDEWFSERSLITSGAVDDAIERLREKGYIFEKEGKVWFRSTAFDDEKDRVLVRDNGLKTYIASDIAYHTNKLDRGYDEIIDIWGSDHHGYVPRVKAAMDALSGRADSLEVLLVQFVNLYEGGEKKAMSTRSGEFITLRQLRREVGNDATRFFYVMRKNEQHLDFDMDLARKQSSENPLYYIQYAHARICSVIRKASETDMAYDEGVGLENIAALTEQSEVALMNTLQQYPALIEKAAKDHEAYILCNYLRQLATVLHSYYDADNKRIRILIDDTTLRNARLLLLHATRQVLQNGLSLIGVSAPESM